MARRTDRARPRRSMLALLVCSLWVPSALARAHGGFWRAHRIHTLGDDDTVLVLQSQLRGLVATEDGGASWRWVCAEAYGRSSTNDARVGMLLTPGPHLLVAGLGSGLTVASLDLCLFEQVEDLAGHVVYDVARAKDRVLALASGAVGETGRRIFHAKLDALRFTMLGSPLPVGFAASDLYASEAEPETLYVAGQVAGALVIARSDAAASEWRLGQPVPHGSALGWGGEILGAAGPGGNELYVLHDELEWSELQPSGDALLVSEDGGESLRVLFRNEAPIRGFALSPDGQTLLVSGLGGLYRAQRAEALRSGMAAFERISGLPHYALHWTERGLYAGIDEFGTEEGQDFGVGVSGDGGDTFQPMMSVCQITARDCVLTGAVGDQCGMVFSDQGLRGGGFKEDFLDTERCLQPDEGGAIEAGTPEDLQHDAGASENLDAGVEAPESTTDEPSDLEAGREDAVASAPSPRRSGGCRTRSADVPSWEAVLLVMWLGAFCRRRTEGSRRAKNRRSVMMRWLHCLVICALSQGCSSLDETPETDAGMAAGMDTGMGVIAPPDVAPGQPGDGGLDGGSTDAMSSDAASSTDTSLPLPSACGAPAPGQSPAMLHRAALDVLTPTTPCGFSDCHAGRGKAGLVLLGAVDLRSALVAKPACEAPAVPLVDGRGGDEALQNSWLWLKLTSDTDVEGALPMNAAWGVGQSCGQLPTQPYGVIMPLASPPLNGAQKEAVRAWICAGAPGPI